MKNNALVCIAKNEDNYIQEWIDYHLKLGFSGIYVYCNDWKYANDDPRVHVTDIAGHQQQLNAYNDFIARHSGPYDWALFIDVDEFLNIKKFSDVGDMFDSYDKFLAVGFNWRLFGDSNIKFDGNYSVLKRFTKCQAGLNRHIKTAINLAAFRKHGLRLPKFVNPHFIDYGYYDKVTVNAAKTGYIIGPWHTSDDLTVPCLHHYFTKTLDEWNCRRGYGRADMDPSGSSFKRTLNEFYEHNFNDSENKELADKF